MSKIISSFNFLQKKILRFDKIGTGWNAEESKFFHVRKKRAPFLLNLNEFYTSFLQNYNRIVLDFGFYSKFHHFEPNYVN